MVSVNSVLNKINSLNIENLVAKIEISKTNSTKQQLVIYYAKSSRTILGISHNISDKNNTEIIKLDVECFIIDIKNKSKKGMVAFTGLEIDHIKMMLMEMFETDNEVH